MRITAIILLGLLLIGMIAQVQALHSGKIKVSVFVSEKPLNAPYADKINYPALILSPTANEKSFFENIYYTIFNYIEFQVKMLLILH